MSYMGAYARATTSTTGVDGTKGGVAMGSPVVHFEVLGTDAERLADFYTGIFGWRVKHGPDDGDPMEYRMISPGVDDTTLAGGIGKSPEGSGAVTFYIDVDNLEATLARIEAAGGAKVGGR